MLEIYQNCLMNIMHINRVTLYPLINDFFSGFGANYWIVQPKKCITTRDWYFV